MTRIRQSTAEAEQQYRDALFDFSTIDQLGEGERDTRGGGVAGLRYVTGNYRIDSTGLLCDRLDDPQVGLMEHDAPSSSGVTPAFRRPAA
ncbi:hypothetical protein JOF55_003765 [Haloactinomyces albus]|uniref:Uncharacterized protein n=1 Tax=Haloactinomyces albus TaxID=1352928 RepID=A0AAE3ZIM0_9ACTN|nr:hypothetical protein [Haloactinomyces albus]